MINEKTKIALTLSFIALLLFSSFVLAENSTNTDSESGSTGGGSSEPVPTEPSSGGGGGGSNSAQGYRNAYFLCHDGSISYQGSESSCKTFDTWSKYGQEFCANKCTSSTSTSATMKCGINAFQVYNECTTSSGGSSGGSGGGGGTNVFIPTISKEQVKCVFENSNNVEKCYTFVQEPTTLTYATGREYSCSGTTSCVVDISGESGTKLTWKSSCGGYAYTTIDGYNEQATFKCVDQKPTVKPIGQPDLVIKNLQVYQKTDSQYGTATWIEYDLANIGNGDVYVKGTPNQGFLNNIYIDGKSIGSIWYWKGLGDDITTDSTNHDSTISPLKAGESLHRGHRFFIYYEGIHKVSVKADSYDVISEKDVLDKSFDNRVIESNEDNNKATVAFNFGTTPSEPEPLEPKSYVNVVISPEKQYTKDGFATYDVIIYDAHPFGCKSTAGESCPAFTPMYSYNLYFSSEQNINGEFENSYVTIPAGSKKVVTLKVQTKYKGTNIFGVTAKSTESKSSAKGILIYGEQPPTEPTSYFNGQGFALSAEKKAGALIDIHLLKDGESIKGKFNLENTNYKVQGSQSNGLIKLKIFSTDSTEEIATLLGTISEFDTFLLLQGNIFPVKNSGKIGNWYLTSFSKKEKAFVVVEDKEIINEPTTKNIQVGEIISVPTEKISEQTGEAKKIFIQSKEVINEKFLLFFPTGKKLLRADVIDENGRVTKITLKPFGKTKVGDYEIRVDSSLEDQKNIEITINKIP